MNLNAMFVVIFAFLGVFAVVFGFMPSGFFANQVDYDLPTQQSKEIASYFSANNVTLYQNTWSGNLSSGGTLQNNSGLPDGHFLEFGWETSVESRVELRHGSPGYILWIIPSPFPDLETMSIYTTKGNVKLTGSGGMGYIGAFTRAHIVSYAEGELLSLYGTCPHIRTSFVVIPAGNQTLLQSWDNGTITIMASYEINFEAMKPGAWTLVSQLMTFQNPDFGVPGDGGTILNYVVAVGAWACIALLIYALITSVIPTIPGWGGG